MSEKIDPKNLIMLDEMAIYNCLNKIIREINLHSFKPEVVVGKQPGVLTTREEVRGKESGLAQSIEQIGIGIGYQIIGETNTIG